MVQRLIRRLSKPSERTEEKIEAKTLALHCLRSVRSNIGDRLEGGANDYTEGDLLFEMPGCHRFTGRRGGDIEKWSTCTYGILRFVWEKSLGWSPNLSLKGRKVVIRTVASPGSRTGLVRRYDTRTV